MFYDALLLLILGYTTWRGAARGVTWQLAGIAAILLCFLFAAPLSVTVAPLIKVDPPLNRWIAMLAIYLAFSFGSFAVARTIRGVLETFQFQEFDKHLGALFGFIKGAVLCLILTFFTVALSESAREKILRTNSGRLAGYLLYKSSAIMPRELDGVLAPYFRKIEGELIEIADEQEKQTGPNRPAALPFDLDPRDDDRDSSPQDEIVDTEDDRPPEVDGESSGESEGTEQAQEDRSLLEEATEAIEDKVRNELSRIVGGVFSGKSSPSDSETPRPSTERPAAGKSPRRPAVTARDDAEVDRLVGEIVQAFSSRKEVREQLHSDIDEMLEGVPATIARQALSDWRSDLYGTSPDPDPGTDFESPLKQRVVRQLEKARVSMNDLPETVRDRLKRPR